MNNNLFHTGLMSYVIKKIFYSIRNRRNFAFLILFILTLSFSACSKGKPTSGGDVDKPNEKFTIAVTEVEVITSEEDTINDIVYGNGRFVAIGKNGKIAYSVDNGITWTAVKNSIFGTDEVNSTTNYSIVYGNKSFVAVRNEDKEEYHSRMAYSSDGIKWAIVKNAIFANGSIGSIAYGNGRFIALSSCLGESGKIVYSADNGATWKAVKNIIFSNDYYISHITYVNDRFVAVGTWMWGCGPQGSFCDTIMAYSNDGITWKKAKKSKKQWWFSRYIYGNGYFVAIGGEEDMEYGWSDYIGYSNDGTTWTRIEDTTKENTSFSNGSINSIAYGNGRFVVVGTVGNEWDEDKGEYKTTGQMAYSSNGKTWTAVKNTTFGKDGISCIAYCNDRFIAGGEKGKMAYSVDKGVTWIAVKDTTFGPNDKAK